MINTKILGKLNDKTQSLEVKFHQNSTLLI